MAKDNNNKFEARWVENENDFYNLASDWDKLAQAINAPLFLQHAWFCAAWQWSKLYSQLKILTIYENNNLIAICPFIIYPTIYRHINVKEVSLLNIPDTQSCDWLVSKHHIKIVFEFAIKSLFQCHFSWDTLNLRLLSDNTAIMQGLAHSDHIYNIKEKNNDIHFYVNLESNWENYYKEKSRRLKKGNNSIVNKLNKAGTLEVCRICPDLKTYQEILNTITSISSTSWKTSVKTALNFEGPQAFIAELFKRFSATGQLIIWLLKLNNKAIAYELQVTQNNNYYALRSDYDLTFQNLSPGTYLNWKIIKTLFEEKSKNYFMGPGRNEYKLRWENRNIPLKALCGYNKTLKGQLICWIDNKIIPTLKLIRG